MCYCLSGTWIPSAMPLLQREPVWSLEGLSTPAVSQNRVLLSRTSSPALHLPFSQCVFHRPVMHSMRRLSWAPEVLTWRFTTWFLKRSSGDTEGTQAHPLLRPHVHLATHSLTVALSLGHHLVWRASCTPGSVPSPSCARVLNTNPGFGVCGATLQSRGNGQGRGPPSPAAAELFGGAWPGRGCPLAVCAPLHTLGSVLNFIYCIKLRSLSSSKKVTRAWW